MRTKLLLRVLAGLAAGFAMIGSARGYVVNNDQSGIYVVKWQSSLVPIKVVLPAGLPLSDGNTLSGSVVAAVQAWNAQLGTVQLAPTVTDGGTYAVDIGVN